MTFVYFSVNVYDASGVEAQTMANVYLALENELEIVTCVNKIDLPNADPEKVMLEVESTIGLDTTNAIKCSAKSGKYDHYLSSFNVSSSLLFDIFQLFVI
jgi:translation elongation factor EF-4